MNTSFYPLTWVNIAHAQVAGDNTSNGAAAGTSTKANKEDTYHGIFHLEKNGVCMTAYMERVCEEEVLIGSQLHLRSTVY